jgi:hypothetical protein
MTIAERCAEAALVAGRAIRELVHAMPPYERGERTTSVLKENQCVVDAAAEALGIEHLARLAADVRHDLLLLVDAATGRTHRIGANGGARCIWVSMDAVDGTVKVAGLGERRPDRVALGNDGGWAAAFAFTEPTERPFASLTVADFATAVIVDGNPTRWPVYPQEVVALGGVTTDGTRRVHTSGETRLHQLWSYLDGYQAHDVATRQPGDEALAVELFRRLADRHHGGAFDVLRQYANLSALPRLLFGWREEPVWVESQGGAYLVVNENQANLIPAVPLVLGAGGVAVDFAGRPLAARRLAEGRTNVLFAANPTVCAQVLALMPPNNL